MRNVKDTYYPFKVRKNLRYMRKGPSVYGEADPVTLTLLGQTTGPTLEIGSGDGRYTLPLLHNADVVASDIFPRELRVLRRRYNAIKRQKRKEIIKDGLQQFSLQRIIHNLIDYHPHKLSTAKVDAFKKFPFDDNMFNTVVCTGFLYLYPPEKLAQVFGEIERVLKPQGKVVFDFVTDRQRVDRQGKEIHGENEIQYSRISGEETIKRILSDRFKQVTIQVSNVNQNLIASAGYTMTATKLNVLAEKI